MNPWLVAAIGMLICMIPCAVVCFRGDAADRLVGLEMAGIISVIILVLLAEGFHRPPFFDLALALGLLSFAAGMVFTRFLERWL